MKKPELLAPAGNIEKLKTALHYGADVSAFVQGLIILQLKGLRRLHSLCGGQGRNSISQ
jgi:hypothetical protein